MATQTRQPSTLSSSTTYHASDFNFPIKKPWVNPGNAAVNDGSLTTATFVVQAGSSGAGTEVLLATNFGFTIPTGAQINGVTVVYEMSRSGGAIGVVENSGRMIIGGVMKNANKADNVTPGTWTGNKSYGGSSDTWGETLTSAIVNASDFGMAITGAVASIGPNTDSGVANIDVIDVTIDYTIVPPSITTDGFSAISSSRATGSATITSEGGNTPDSRGFVVDIYSHTDPGNVAPASSGYATRFTESGSFPAASFDKVLTGLIPGATLYVRSWAHNSAGYAYGNELVLETLDATLSSFEGYEVTNIVREVIDMYSTAGGYANYGPGTTDNTGVIIDKVIFNTNTILEGIQQCLTYAPGDFYWYVDLGTNALYWKETATVADYVFVKGIHIENLAIVASTENLKNKAYVIGGAVGGSNLYSVYSNTSSIATYGQRIDRQSNNRIQNQSAADAFGRSILQAKAKEQYQTVVTIPDSVMDITLFRPGQVVTFRGFGTFVDQLLLQIVRIDYTPDQVTLSLGVLAPRTSGLLEDVRRGLIAQQTVDNPSTPN